MGYPSVFVTGCARSGTYLVQVLLRSLGLHGEYTERHLQYTKIEPGLVVKKPYRPRDVTEDWRVALELGFKTVVVFRDGRDVMTSLHPLYTSDYYIVDPERWVRSVEVLLPFVRQYDGKEAIGVRYEDLVADVRGTLGRVAEFLNLPVPTDPLAELKKVPEDSNAWLAMRGQTKLSNRLVGRWRNDVVRVRGWVADPKMRERVCRCLEKLGYEKDRGWLRELEKVAV